MHWSNASFTSDASSVQKFQPSLQTLDDFPCAFAGSTHCNCTREPEMRHAEGSASAQLAIGRAAQGPHRQCWCRRSTLALRIRRVTTSRAGRVQYRSVCSCSAQRRTEGKTRARFCVAPAAVSAQTQRCVEAASIRNRSRLTGWIERRKRKLVRKLLKETSVFAKRDEGEAKEMREAKEGRYVCTRG